MKVIFVGIHNKEGMKPLDSISKSGKLIDVIIKQIPLECIKTNLFDTDYMPLPDEWGDFITDWYFKIKPSRGDIVVLLGQITHNIWDKNAGSIVTGAECGVIKIGHPSAVWSAEKKIWYVNNAVSKIQKASK